MFYFFFGMKMSEFKDRLAIALSESKMKGNELASAIGVSPGTVSHWRKGTRQLPKGDALLKMASVLNVSADWLVSGEGEKEAQNIIPLDKSEEVSEGFIQIPEYRVTFGCGDAPEPTYDEIEDTEKATYRLSYFVDRGINPKYCKRFRVIGDSMDPLIRAGDCILVDCANNQQIVDNSIYAIVYDHSLRVKRLIKTFKNLIIRSDNPTYKDEILTPEEANQIIIIGKVVERCGDVS